MKSSTWRLFSFAAALLSIQLNAVGANSNTKSEPVTEIKVALDWVPNTNHTGLYVAAHEKFFEAEKLRASFIQPTQSTTTQLVAAGSVPFGVSYKTDVLRARDAGMPIVSIAAIIQENTSCFAWRTSTGIRSPKDWEGKRYGGWGSPEETATLKYIMKKHGADFSKLKVVTTGLSDFLPSTERNADIMWIYLGWDGVRAEQNNVKIGTLCLRDFGAPLNHHSPLLITSEKLVRENPALVRRFVAAASRGYRVAIDNPARASSDLLKQVPELDKKFIEASAKYLSKEYAKGAKQWGMQNGELWKGYAQWLKEQKLIKNADVASIGFTNEFLPKPER